MREDIFRCRACGKRCTHEESGVRSVDTSGRWGFPDGTLQENYTYCAGNPSCKAAAEAWTGTAPKED
jgi:hypothetical protein